MLLIKLMKEQWTYQILKIQLSKATEEAHQFSLNGRVTQTNGPRGVTSKVLTTHVEDSWNIQNGLTHLKEKKN